ncbi:MAG: PUA domain-containing protein [Actinomycetota bacterium]|nr:hypothetical protein [Actinomycetota bacterium]
MLAAGVDKIEGAFDAGDAVLVMGPRGFAVAKGLVNFGASELVDIAGTKAAKEVIHRDHLVVL